MRVRRILYGGSHGLRNFYGHQLTCVRRERGGRDGHHTRDLPGGRGDALMSLLFSLGQHQAFVAIHARLQWEENSASGRCPHDLAERAQGACQDQGASRQVTGVEQRRFPSDRGRRIDQGPGSQTRCPLSGKVISICRWIIRVLRVPGAPIGTLGDSLKPNPRNMQFSWTGSPPLQSSKQPWLLLLCLGATRANFQFEDGQTAAGAAVSGERRRER